MHRSVRSDTRARSPAGPATHGSIRFDDSDDVDFLAVVDLIPERLQDAAQCRAFRIPAIHQARDVLQADVARTSLLLVFAFAGVEVALVPSGEVKDPARTVPRAIALAMIGITLLYILLQVVAQGILGGQLATATASPLADAAGASLGGVARAALLAGASISTFGYMGGVTLSMPRMLYAFARDRFLPGALASVHPRTRAPQAAIVVQSLLTLILALSGSFETLAVLANICALAVYFGCALAAWRLRRAHPPSIAEGFAAPAGRVVPWLASAVILWLLTGVTGDEWLAFVGCVAAASLLYAVRRGRLQPA